MTSRDGWVEMLTGADWERVQGRGGRIVISDPVNDRAEGGPKYHRPGCSFVKLENFEDKVAGPLRDGLKAKGRYWWVVNSRVAEEGGARPCEHPADRL